jgi:RND family efflux transporter MFP subunit
MAGVTMQRETEIQKEFKAQDSTSSNPVTQKTRNSRKHWLAPAIVLLVVAALLISGILSRLRHSATLRVEAGQMAVTPVSVVLPKGTAPTEEIVLPANVQPYITSPIYAQATGYLKKWYFDIGAHVKTGQLLAVIQSPKVDQQLEQARSNLLTAQANLELASITKARYQGLLKSNAVSQQDVDNAVGTYNANAAIEEADKAAVQRYSALVAFEKVYAPFDGVITARNTDIGDLINSGNTGNPKTDLFHIAQTKVLRVYVNVPEEYSQEVKPGQIAELTLAEFPGREFPGVLVRTAEAINLATRTLPIEIDVNNPTGTLLTGSYAEVHLKLPAPATTYVIPANTLIFRSEGLQVALARGGQIVLTSVTPGHDLGNMMEIVAGLKADDQIVVNPPNSIVSGQKVQIVQATLPGDVK